MTQARTSNRFTARFLLSGLVLLAASLLLPSPAVGAEGALEVLQVGWDGTVVPGAWSPVRMRATGGSSDLNARIEVVLKARYQPGPQVAAVEYPIGAYGQEVALPAGVAKEVTIWVPVDSAMVGTGGMAGNVLLRSAGQTLAEQRVEFKSARTPFWPLVGVLAESPTVARALSQVELPVQGLPLALSVANLSAVDIPATAEHLGALNALVVEGDAAGTLTGEQRRAVQEWVAAGGHLLLAGGPQAARSASVLPSGLLPLTFSGTEGSADLSALAQWAGQRGTMSQGPLARFKAGAGSLLAGAPELPLAWRLGLGQGSVTLLAADPALEPLASWTGTPALLQKALEPAMPDPAENEKMRYIRAQDRDNPLRLQGAVEALSPEAFPGWKTIALILGIFALLVGPLLHLVLWKADRRGWVWLAVPAGAVLLSGTLYFLGIGRGGRDVLANVVAYVRLDPEGNPARQTLMAGFFAPTHARLDLTVPGGAPVRAVGRADFGPFGPGGMMPAAASSDPPFRVVGGRDTRVEFPSGQWAMRSVVLSRRLDREVGKIESHLGLEGGLIKGTLRNDTPFALEDAAVIVGQNLVKLGGLAPGQTAPVVLDPGRVANPFEGEFPMSWRLFGRPPEGAASGVSGGKVMSVAVSSGMAVPASAGMMVPPGMSQRLELPPDPEVQRRVRLMEPLVNGPRMGPGGAVMPLTFLAFTRDPVGKDFPTAGEHPTYYLSLLEQPIQLELPPGPFSIPGSLTPPNVLSQTGGFGGGGNGTIFWIQLYGGSVTYSFRPPMPAKAKAEALTITTQQVGPSVAMSPSRGPMPTGPNVTPGPAEADLFSVYNWQSAAWELLPGGREQVRLEPASRYLGPDGLIKLQVNAGPDRSVNFVLPELTVEGRVEE